MAKIDQKFHKNSKSKFDDEREEYQELNQQDRKKQRRVGRQRYEAADDFDYEDFSQ
jgi:hypothetical protein